MMRNVLVAVGLSLILAAPALAAKPTGGGPFEWTLVDRSIASLVEQQSGPTQAECVADPSLCVWNPTAEGPTQYGEGCFWDIDDSATWFAGPGMIAPGTTATSYCLIADSVHRQTGIILTSKSPDLVVTIGFEPQHVTFTLAHDTSGRDYVYWGCLEGPRYSDRSQGQTIEGSNNGWGVPTLLTLSVTNPTDRGIRDSNAKAEVGIGSIRQEYCRSALTPWFPAGGAVWRTGL